MPNTVTVPIIYYGIELVSPPSTSFEIELAGTWSGATIPSPPTQFGNPNVIFELDGSGNFSPSTAMLSITSVTPNGSGSYTISLVASNFLASTTAIYFSFTLNLALTYNAGDTLTMTYSTVATNPVTTTYPFSIPVNPTTALRSSPTVLSISSNTNYPAPVATTPTAIGPGPRPIPLATAAHPVDTTVTIPVTVPPTLPSQTYLTIVFIVQMVFGPLLLPPP